MGETASAIRKHMIEHPEGDGMVVGDQMRLRQIVTNLARWVKLWPFCFHVGYAEC